MSQIFDCLTFFRKYVDRFSNGFGVVTNENRAWEDSCRQRWQHDKIVRSTHGTNCTCSCSWKIYVKNGLVTWETQQTDYPRTRPDMPNHEPRGCSRGASYSWYLYSGNRLKYPLVRARLVELCRAARQTMNPVEAWTSIVSNPDKRRHYTSIRGRGGFVRASWDDVTEIIAAANAYTIKTYGPDRVAGFSPIPAMSMVSYAAGTRYLSLLGGTSSGKAPYAETIAASTPTCRFWFGWKSGATLMSPAACSRVRFFRRARRKEQSRLEARRLERGWRRSRSAGFDRLSLG